MFCIFNSAEVATSWGTLIKIHKIGFCSSMIWRNLQIFLKLAPYSLQYPGVFRIKVILKSTNRDFDIFGMFTSAEVTTSWGNFKNRKNLFMLKYFCMIWINLQLFLNLHPYISQYPVCAKKRLQFSFYLKYDREFWFWSISNVFLAFLECYLRGG